MESITNVHNVACSGARIADVTSTGVYKGQSGRLGEGGLNLSMDQLAVHQQAALLSFVPGEVQQTLFVERYHPRAIIVGIGGNDTGFMDKIIACMMPDECEWVEPAGKAQTREEIAGLQPKLTALYTELHRRSPDSRIYVVGYPQIIKPDGACDTLTNTLLDATERKFIQESIHYTDQVIAAAAEAGGATYVDIEQAFGEHALCGGNTDVAVNEVQLGNDVSPLNWLKFMTLFGNETFHPTPLGHQLIAHAIHEQFPHLDSDNSCTPERCPIVNPAPPVDWTGDAPVSAIATQLVAQPQVALHTSQLTVSLYKGELQPNSVTRIEVHSQSILLASPNAAQDGSLQVVVPLPQLDIGSHTLHLYGLSYSGQPIDLYQTIIVRSDSVLPQSVGTTSIALLPTQQGDTQSTIGIPGSLFVRRASLPQTLVSPVTARSTAVKGAQTTMPSTTEPVIGDWWRLVLLSALVAATVVVMIIVTRPQDPVLSEE